ncbi:MAG: hypothetical protein ACYS1C_02290 [Planctomycetota bacterium]|jgi:hypothetical protein
MRRSSLLPVALIVLALAPAPARAAWQSTRVPLADRLTCVVGTPLSHLPEPQAMLPLRFEFDNAGPERTIRALVEREGGASATFAVPSNATSHHWVYMPAFRGLPLGVSLSFYDGESGRLLKRHDWQGFRLTGVSGGAVGGELTAFVVSAGRDLTVSSTFCGRATVSFVNLRPGSLPDRWLGLDAVDLLIVEHAAWVSPRMDQAPVLDWVAMGGLCLMVDAPAEARQRIAAQVSDAVPLVSRRGGTLEAGMGRIMFLDREDLLRSAFFSGPIGRGAGFRPRVGQRHRWRPMLEVVQKPPFVALLILLVLFSLLVGPLGWWYLVSKRGRPLLYYALAPVLSGCFIVVVIAADLLRQGIRPRASLIAVEVIDQAAKKRITLSQFGLYCPFTAGLRLRGQVGEMPHFLSLAYEGGRSYGRGSYGLGGIRSAATPEGVFYDGALPARQRAWYARQEIRLERRRLEVWREEGRLVAENHLGIALADLVVCREGEYAEYAVFEGLEDGARASADPVRKAEALAHCDERLELRQVTWGRIVRGKAGDMLGRWRQVFASGGNAYAARRAGSFEELIWLDSVRFGQATSMIWGVY